MLKRLRSSTLSAAVAAALLLSLAGCGGQDTPPTSGEPVALRMTVWTGNENHLALFNSIADAYVAANGDQVSSITFETLPYDEYTQTLTTQIMGGNAPDLAWILEGSGPEFVDSGALVDLKPTLQAVEGYDLDDILGSALALWEKDGGVYAYPFSNSPFGILVNTTMLTAAGQPLPGELLASGQWTWDKLLEIATGAAQATGKAGFYVGGYESYLAWQYLAEAWDAWGAAPWSEDGSTCTFTDQAMVDFMTWYHDGVYEAGAITEAGVRADFYAGESALTTAQISKVAGLDGSFEWDMVPLPSGPAGLQPVIGQAGVGVLTQSDHSEVAADFLAFFTNPANSAKLAQYFPPPRQSVLTVEVLGAANPLLTTEQIEAVVIGQMSDAVTLPSHVKFAQVSDAAKIALDGLWTRGADVTQVMGNICTAIQPLLGS
ncbi:MAG: extracellular solute-binding protein [Propionibacteriaceae bacterium]|jgi:multiple sugar transport system substrate-binding protein|nr:extracellular solute-binding protein [Propionibacteriaceae bacterium]